MTNILVPKLFAFAKLFRVFSYSVPPFLVSETLHVACKKYKVKKKLLLFLIFHLVS